MSGSRAVLFGGPVRYPAAAAMWRAAFHVSAAFAAVPVAAATRAPAAAADLVVATAASAADLPSFDVLFECAPFLGLCLLDFKFELPVAPMLNCRYFEFLLM